MPVSGVIVVDTAAGDGGCVTPCMRAVMIIGIIA